MNSDREIFGVRIPPPVSEKIGGFEFALDSILLAVWLILALAWSALWFTIWVVIAIPIFVALMAVCYFFELLFRPFRKESEVRDK
jgi:hypothetical protein